MLATVAEIITSTRYLLNEATASFWSDTELTTYINEGQEIMANETGLLSSYYSRVLEAADITNGREVRMSSDFIAIDEGGVLYNDKPLTPTSLKRLDEWYGRSWRSTTGTPTEYYMKGDMIGFYPPCVVGDTVKYYGIQRATELSGATVPLAGDYRTIAFRSYIRDYAVGMAWYKKNEIDKYTDMMNRFYTGVNRIKTLIRQSRNQQPRFIPEYRSKIGYHSTDALGMR